MLQRRVLLLLPLLLVSGCKTPQNAVLPRDLDQGQQELVSLLGNDREIMLFTLDVSGQYKGFDVWVELYEGGELADPRYAGLTQQAEAPVSWRGELAVTVSQTPDLQWHFTLLQDGIQTSSTSERRSPPQAVGWSAGQVGEPIAVTGDTAHILGGGLYSSSGSMSVRDWSDYEENSALLREYEFAYLIKCKFYT